MDKIYTKISETEAKITSTFVQEEVVSFESLDAQEKEVDVMILRFTDSFNGQVAPFQKEKADIQAKRLELEKVGVVNKETLDATPISVAPPTI